MANAPAARESGDIMEPLRVLIADAQGLVRAGLRALLEREPDLCVVAEAASAEEAVARAGRADAVLLDFDLPPAGGVAVARRLPGARILMLMPPDSDDAVLGALRAGAGGLLAKDAAPDELVRAVRVVAAGEALLAPRFARRVVADVLARPERPRRSASELEELTAREREVVALVACGLSNQEIAERLVVTRATAKTHVSRALCKLGARDRAQLVVLAYEAGLVRPVAAPDRVAA
jgi:DNA-binding NarL/FixJ family response regulator